MTLKLINERRNNALYVLYLRRCIDLDYHNFSHRKKVVFVLSVGESDQLC